MPPIVTDNLLANVPCGIFVFSGSGVIQYMNEPLLAELGYLWQELENKSIETILTLSSRIFYQTHLFPLLKLHKKANEIYLTLLNKNKDAVPVLLNASQHIQGETELNICACTTVYERRKYEDEILNARRIAEEALHKNEELQLVRTELEREKERLDRQLTLLNNKNKELSQLNDLFAHDLQEPVRKVSLFTDVIMNDKTRLFNDKPDALFNIIYRSSQKMQKLLRGVQDYLYLNNDNIERKPVDLNEVLKEALEEIKQKFPGVDAKVEMENLPVIEGNVSQLSILFMELLHNSFQFRSSNSPQIKICCTIIEDNVYNNRADKYRYIEFARISLCDDGIGIRTEVRDNVFRILKKGDSESDRLGMGLALCKKIVENHGGNIVLATDINSGSKFVITIPLLPV